MRNWPLGIQAACAIEAGALAVGFWGGLTDSPWWLLAIPAGTVFALIVGGVAMWLDIDRHETERARIDDEFAELVRDVEINPCRCGQRPPCPHLDTEGRA